MSYLTVEVEIAHGRIVPREPEKLPQNGIGFLTILEPRAPAPLKAGRRRMELPLIQGDGRHTINPTPEELVASLWGD